MEVLEIVQSAAFKSGLVSSFDPNELPGDYSESGRISLANEILPMLNCDRTLDITVTSRVYAPNDGVIILQPFSQPRENFVILGYSSLSSTELTTVKDGNTGFARYMHEQHPEWITETTVPGGLVLYTRKDSTWPQDDFGNFIEFAVWGTDFKLVSGTAPTTPAIMPNVNVDFPPMRVDAVLDEGSRIKYEYLYRDEFDRVVDAAIPCIYTTEEYEDKIIILMKGTAEPKRIVMPVPLQLINSDHEHPGTIIAPPKFRRYLIDATAVSLAVIYGLSTVDTMRQQAEQSYQMLKKNKPQPLHRMNVSEEINHTLRHGIGGRKFYAGF